MTSYRFYCFDGAGGLWTVDDVERASDEEAIDAAGALNTGVKCEVWDGKRLVATIESPSPPAGRAPSVRRAATPLRNRSWRSHTA